MTPAHTCCLPPPIPIALHRPWWRRAWDRLTAPRDGAAIAAADERALYRSLGHLSDQTLRDIGAPSWLRERDPALELRRLERERW